MSRYDSIEQRRLDVGRVPLHQTVDQNSNSDFDLSQEYIISTNINVPRLFPSIYLIRSVISSFNRNFSEQMNIMICYRFFMFICIKPKYHVKHIYGFYINQGVRNLKVNF